MTGSTLVLEEMGKKKKNFNPPQHTTPTPHTTTPLAPTQGTQAPQASLQATMISHKGKGRGKGHRGRRCRRSDLMPTRSQDREESRCSR